MKAGVLLLGWAMIVAGAAGLPARADEGEEGGLWERARRRAADHRFSTLFTAHDVRRHLATEEGLAVAIEWCRRTAVTKVFLETFRDGYEVEAAQVARARDRFRAEGFQVAGCITPTNVGKKSNRWNIIACYSDPATQDRLGRLFERAAGWFDEVMIDDFLFTECSCAECDAARSARQVRVGGRVTVPAGDGWEEYRRELMRRVSAERVIEPARRSNPRCRLILKFPQWYDVFHERGYDVEEQTRMFDGIWVGTETRDYDDKQWGGTVQYEGFFIMRWLGGIGGAKCGGGWYDWLGTTERTYVEQARETVLGGARESLLFCYGGLQGTTGPRNVAALRAEIPELLRVAGEVGRRRLRGVAAYKPPNSPPGPEKRVFDFVGMLGLPLVPCHEFPMDAPAAFLSVHATRDPDLVGKLRSYLAAGRRVLVTDGLAALLPESMRPGRDGVQELPVGGDPQSLLRMPAEEVKALRRPLLEALGVSFEAPPKVAFTLFDDGSSVVRNFNDVPVRVEVDGHAVTVAERGWVCRWR